MVIMRNGYVNMSSLSHAPNPNCLQPHPGVSWTLKNVKLMFELWPSGSIGQSSRSKPLYSAWYPLAVKNGQDSYPTKASKSPLRGDDVLPFLLDKELNCLQTVVPGTQGPATGRALNCLHKVFLQPLLPVAYSWHRQQTKLLLDSTVFTKIKFMFHSSTSD